MPKNFHIIEFLMLVFMSTPALAASAGLSIAKVAEVYVKYAEKAHSGSLDASHAAMRTSKNAIANGPKESQAVEATLNAVKHANENANFPKRDTYDSAQKLAAASAKYVGVLESEIMSQHKAAVAEAKTAKALAVVAEDGARNAENLSTNADALAAKFKFSIGPNDKDFLKKSAEKARALANEAAEKAEQARVVAEKTIDQVSLANKAALRAKEIVAGIKPYTGTASPK